MSQQISKFIYFCKCGYSNHLAKSTGSHMRYCHGTPPGEHQCKHKCKLCKVSSQTDNGLLVHRSASHKGVYNEELKEKEKNYKWTVW